MKRLWEYGSVTEISFGASLRLSSSRTVNQLPQHLGDICAVDLVDDEDVGLAPIGSGAPSDTHEHTIGRFEPESGAGLSIAFARHWAQTFDEFLVAVGLVEGDELDPTLAVRVGDEGPESTPDLLV